MALALVDNVRRSQRERGQTTTDRGQLSKVAKMVGVCLLNTKSRSSQGRQSQRKNRREEEDADRQDWCFRIRRQVVTETCSSG